MYRSLFLSLLLTGCAAAPLSHNQMPTHHCPAPVGPAQQKKAWPDWPSARNLAQAAHPSNPILMFKARHCGMPMLTDVPFEEGDCQLHKEQTTWYI